MSFLIAVIVPYYRDQMGLTFHDFLIGEAAFAAVVVLLEVPSGWISDVWHRKFTLALAVVFEIIGYACLLLGEGLWLAILAQSIIGVAISLISGTNSAMLYDSLLSEGRESEYRVREGKRSALGFYSVGAASVVSGFLYAVDQRLPLWMSLASLALALLTACLMVEPSRHRKLPEKHPVADMIETGRYALRGHPEIGMIILFSAVMFCATKMIMWSQQPYYMAMRLPEQIFGVLMAAGFAMAGLSSHLGHMLDGRISSVKALAAVWMVAVLVCLGASAHLGWSGVVLLMIGGTCLYGVGAPRVSEAINRRVGSERRATILSTQNLMVSLFFIPVSFVIGWISDRHGVTGALLGTAGWLAMAGLCLLFLLTRKSRRHMLLL